MQGMKQSHWFCLLPQISIFVVHYEVVINIYDLLSLKLLKCFFKVLQTIQIFAKVAIVWKSIG